MTVTAPSQEQYQTYVFTGEKQAGAFFHTITRELDFPERLEEVVKLAREEVKSENFTNVYTIADLLVILNTIDFNKKANQQLFFKLLEDHELVRKYFLSNVLKADVEITEELVEFPVTTWQAGETITPQRRIEYVNTAIGQIVTKLTNKFLGYTNRNGEEIPGNPFIGQALFEKCPETVKLLSSKALVELAEKNTGMAFAIFADAELRANVIDHLKKEYTSQKIAVYFAKLLAKAPERIGQHWQDYFHRIFKYGLENFSTEISYLLELSTGLPLKKLYENRAKDEQRTLQAIFDEIKTLNLGLISTREDKNKSSRIQRVFFSESRAELLALTKAAELKDNKAFKAPFFIAMREIQDNAENFKKYFGNKYYGKALNPSKELLYLLNYGKNTTKEPYHELYRELTTHNSWYKFAVMVINWSYQETFFPPLTWVRQRLGQWVARTGWGQDYLLKYKQHNYIQKQLADAQSKPLKETAASVVLASSVKLDNELSETTSNVNGYASSQSSLDTHSESNPIDKQASSSADNSVSKEADAAGFVAKSIEVLPSLPTQKAILDSLYNAVLLSLSEKSETASKEADAETLTVPSQVAEPSTPKKQQLPMVSKILEAECATPTKPNKVVEAECDTPTKVPKP